MSDDEGPSVGPGTKLVDPKVLLANERTYLAWTKMSVTLGSVGLGLLAAGSDQAAREALRPDVTAPFNSAWYVGCVLLPVAAVFIIYAGWMWGMRDRKIRRNDYTDLTNETIPLVLGGVLVLSLTAVLAVDLFGAPIARKLKP
jgi:uncharacterized membrane protein YidH (DUF202 family)